MNQLKSKQRAAKHGEVFTSQKEVESMLDLVLNETERIESKFLEQACGTGNFLEGILKRKLDSIKYRYKNNQYDFELNSIIIASTLYGIDIQEDNIMECRDRLFYLFFDYYKSVYKNKVNELVIESFKFILSKNIIHGDALTYKYPTTNNPIVFTEWMHIGRGFIKRRDFIYKFLVEKENQFQIENDVGNIVAIDEPIKEYPSVHFYQLKEYE